MRLGEYELRAVVACAVKREIDRASAPRALANSYFLNDLCVGRPILDRVAIDACSRRPWRLGLQLDPALDRQAQEERKRALGIRIACNEKRPVHCDTHTNRGVGP